MEAKTRFLPLVALLVLLLLGGCVAQTQITNTWRDSAYVGVRFQKLLVMGFGEDGANRRVFEDQFVHTLRTAGINAVASYTLVSGLSDTDLPRVKEAVAKSGADAVLTTRLVGLDKRVNVYPAQTVVMPSFGYRRSLHGYYSSVMVMPASTYDYTVVTLETNLWRVPGESLVWSGTSETFAPEEAHKVAADFARVIVEALRGQGLL